MKVKIYLFFQRQLEDLQSSINQEKLLINEQKAEIEKKLLDECDLRKCKEKEMEATQLNLVSAGKAIESHI